jgi:hypothetical protein
MSLIFATQLAALATLALAVLALATAILAGLALRKQFREVAILVAENKRQAGERRRAQASQVFISAEPYRPNDAGTVSVISVSVSNTSLQPIYDVYLLWHGETGEWIGMGDPVDLRVLLPGEKHDWGTSIEPSLPIRRVLMDPYLIGAAITFRDAAGVHWQLGTDGQLAEILAPGDGKPALA